MDPQAPARSTSLSNVTTAKLLAGVALLCGVVTLAGWALHIPILQRFLPTTYPMWPVAALGYTCVAIGVLADQAERHRVALPFYLAGMAVGILATAQTLIGPAFDLGTLLFPSQIAAMQVPHAGRPGVNAIVFLLMLPVAAFASRSRWRLLREVAPLVAIAPLALALASVTAMMLAANPSAVNLGLRASLPGTIMAFSLTAAILLGHWRVNEQRSSRIQRSDPLAINILVAGAILLPALPATIELLLERSASAEGISGHLVLALFNVMAIGLIAYWAVHRVGREQSARAELSLALDSATVVMTDARGMIIHWSMGCQQLYGWSEEEALGQNLYMLLHAHCPNWNSSYALPDADGAQELIEQRKDGSQLHVIERLLRSATPTRGAIVVHSILDISERVSALRALRASEERLAQATAAHELGIFDWDVGSDHINWSPGTEQRLGLPLGSLSSFESWKQLIDPDDLESLRSTVIHAVAERAERFSFRYRLTGCKGAERTLEGSARSFYDGAGNLVRVVGAALDITERDEREAALRRREAQLRTVLETVPDAMIVLGGDGTILQFSAAAEQLWGYRASEVVTRHFTMLIPQDEIEGYEEVLQRFVETGEGLAGEVLVGTAITADGRRFPAEMRSGAARSDGHLLITVFIRDLTERVAAEQRLSELNNEIAHVSRQSAMSEMAADLAHELNQPLSATANFLAAARMLIERGEGGPRVTDLLRMGSEQTQRAGEIIRRLRAFVARGEVEMRVESVERTVRDAVELVLVGTGHFNLRVAFHLDPGARFILADRIQVQQVLVNLLRNAVQALKLVDPDDRQITITSEKLPDQMIAITVTDSGPGLPAHVLENLFSRFSTTKGGAGGMGIGLSISKRIIEGHGGCLSAENAPGGGASFRFTLPGVEEGEE
ncbi:PAS domain-containing sensor histidine kinase [Sphingomonas azotifigens]|uniref:PAS domain-containing sensor histidine kinase n=1 Tax=Sphingomonas azotifigens TaxID=330920 RepID=UPI000A06B5ED|nr:PAS domain S-box protein [Sphingomonas azotifigens]